MFRTTGFLTLSILLALSGACGDDDTTSGRDAGPGTDSGPGFDSGPGTDSGPGVDSGPVADGGDTDGGDTDGGDTDGGDTDGGAGTCPDLAPTQGDANLIISQIDLANDMVEFFNPTDTAIDLEGYVLCQRPQYMTLGAAAGTVPAGGYLTISTGTVSFAAVGAGEFALYDKDSITTPADYVVRANMVDFVCWDGDRSPSRKGVAEMLDGGEVLWTGPDGPCAASPTNDAVRRNIGVDGTVAADYDVVSAFETHVCL